MRQADLGTLDLAVAGLAPEVRVHRRHPRCGCGWAELGGRHDGPTPGHQKSESSLPSIERRFSREQVSQ